MSNEELPNLYSGLSDRRLLHIASNWVAQAVTVPAKSGLIGVPQALLEELMRRLGAGAGVAQLEVHRVAINDLIARVNELTSAVSKLASWVAYQEGAS